MKTSMLLALGTSLLLTGCGEKSSTPAQNTNAASSGNPLTAPVDYLDAAGKAKRSAEKTVDVTSLTKAIDMFHVDKGRFPKDLKELVSEEYIRLIPEPPYGTKLQYDVATGKVKIVPQ